jgi:hypothetical protein
MPLQATEFSVHADVQIVLFTHRDLRAVQDALGTALEAEQHVAVVIELAAFDEGGQVGGQFADLQAGDVLGEVLCMGADVADAAGRTAALGVGAPGGLLLAGSLDSSGEPTLRVLDHNLADLPQLARVHQVASFFHQRVAGVVVGQSVQASGLLDDGCEFLGFSQIEGGRLVAQHVESGLQGGLGRGKVDVIRSNDGHEVNPLVGRQRSLLGHEFLVASVHPIRGEEEVRTGGLGLLCIR